MILKNTNYYCNNIIPNKLCDHLIHYFNVSKKENATVFGNDGPENQHKNLEIRDSNIVWIDDQWVYKDIIPLFYRVNKEAGWNFNISWFENAQITKYGKGQFYNWHPDQHPESFKKERGKNLEGKIRKISMTMLLNDPSEYEGGDLEFKSFDDFANPQQYFIERKNLRKGSAIFFPSFLHHRVKPVTKGTRYSLVIWSCGHPYI